MDRQLLMSLIVLIVWTCGTVEAQPVRWEVADGGNGHWYEARLGPLLSNGVPSVIIWDDAYLNAEAAGGYLATITSPAENEFVFSLVDSPEFWSSDTLGGYFGPWLGGWQKPGSTEPAADWRWVTGEPFVYSNWHDGEPNDLFGQVLEDRILYFAAEGTTGPRSNFWNDENGRRRIAIAYVVEYVPEPPATLCLVPFACAGLLWVRSRHRSRPTTIGSIPVQGSSFKAIAIGAIASTVSILASSTICHAHQLTFTVTDPVGQEDDDGFTVSIGRIDLTRMQFTFDDLTGIYETQFAADLAHPFVDAFRLNVNLLNPDTVTPLDFFSDAVNDFELDSPTTTFALAGTNHVLTAWHVGDRVAVSGPTPLGLPLGSGISAFQTGEFDLPFEGFGDRMAWGHFATTTIVPEPSRLLIVMAGSLFCVLSSRAFGLRSVHASGFHGPTAHVIHLTYPRVRVDTVKPGSRRSPTGAFQ